MHYRQETKVSSANYAAMVGLLALVSGIAGCRSAAAFDAAEITANAQYPSEMHGTWDLGPETCKLPTNPDSDSPIRIGPQALEGYEHTEDPQSVIQLSKEPLAWRIVETSEIAPGIQTIGIYVLKDDHLVITTGDEVTRYRRCR